MPPAAARHPCAELAGGIGRRPSGRRVAGVLGRRGERAEFGRVPRRRRRRPDRDLGQQARDLCRADHRRRRRLLPVMAHGDGATVADAAADCLDRGRAAADALSSPAGSMLSTCRCRVSHNTPPCKRYDTLWPHAIAVSIACWRTVRVRATPRSMRGRALVALLSASSRRVQRAASTPRRTCLRGRRVLHVAGGVLDRGASALIAAVMSGTAARSALPRVRSICASRFGRTRVSRRVRSTRRRIVDGQHGSYCVQLAAGRRLAGAGGSHRYGGSAASGRRCDGVPPLVRSSHSTVIAPRSSLWRAMAVHAPPRALPPPSRRFICWRARHGAVSLTPVLAPRSAINVLVPRRRIASACGQ